MPKGGWRWNAGRPGWKRKAEQSLRLDVRDLQRCGRLKPGTAFSWHWSYGDEPAGSIGIGVEAGRVVLRYVWTPQGGAATPIECPIPLIETPCHYGGTRLWFACPCCGRRCAVVYFGGRVYACRKCLNVAYASQSEDQTNRLWRKQRKIERKLSGGAGEWNRWQKPKGMHQATFDRLREQVYECEAARDEILCQYATRIFPHLRK